jgi:DNA polymerase (family 10)
LRRIAQYVAITDHSRRLNIARGLDADRLAGQIDMIDHFNETSRDIVLLKGIKIEILEDGTLDHPASARRRLDLVVGAVHSHFKLSRTRQTERIMRAINQPCFSILEHPTGRLIGERETYEVDLERLVRHARERGCFLELNAHPDHLDLDDIGCRMARDGGMQVAIASDSHDENSFAALRFGVGQARRGWLECKHMVNTLPF